MGKTMLLAFVFSILGFSYAVATSQSVNSAAPLSASVRAAGTNFRNPLQYITPFIPGGTDRDLGDAAFGSSFVRWARAKGGVPPLRYSADHGNTEFKGQVSLQDAVSALPASVGADPKASELLLTGRLQGIIGKIGGGTAGTSTPVRFDVTVTDSRGVTPNTLTETFRLTMVDSNTFKFGRSSLSDGVQFKIYHDKMEAVAGATPYNFTATNITLTTSAGTVIPINSLTDDMGLFLGPKSGELSGRPLQAGVLNFTMNCTDKNGVKALSRDRTTIGQQISINIADNTRITSEVFSTGIGITGDTSTTGKDTIKYSGLVALTDSVSKLAGDEVTLQIGNYTSPSVMLDATGRGSTPSGSTPFMSVSLSFTGELRITIKDESFAKTGSILPDITLKNIDLPVSVTIGNDFDANELLKFGVKAKGTVFQMGYKFGPGNLGGAFFLTSVTGKDSGAGDIWAIKYVFIPPSDKKFNNAATATIGIGTDFTDTIKVINSGTGKIGTGEKRDPKMPVVTKVDVSNTGQGFVMTGPLPTSSNTQNVATSLPTAASAKVSHTRFPFIIDFNDSTGKKLFGGEGGITIFTDNKGTWQSKSHK